MSKERTWFLIGKKLAGEASAEELNELEGLLRSDPDMHYALQNITDLWSLQAPPANNEVDDAFDRHLNRLKAADVNWDQSEANELQPGVTNTQKRSRKALLIISMAAAVLMAASLYWYNSVTSRSKASRPFVAAHTAEKNEVSMSTRNGSKSKITLPDGSKVWLNAGSVLTYNKDFGGEIREVNLSGEAFFEVTSLPLAHAGEGGKEGKVPFIIHTQHIDVRVLGTAFNVKAYPSDKQTETSLIHGKVEVLIHKRPDQRFTLRPNDKLVVMNDEEIAPVTGKSGALHNEFLFSMGRLTHIPADTSVVVETAWVENKLVFDNESFEEAAPKIERWYNVQINFSDAKIKEVHFSGKFENETIQQVLDYLSMIGPCHYSMHGNKVIIGR